MGYGTLVVVLDEVRTEKFSEEVLDVIRAAQAVCQMTADAIVLGRRGPSLAIHQQALEELTKALEKFRLMNPDQCLN